MSVLESARFKLAVEKVVSSASPRKRGNHQIAVARRAVLQTEVHRYFAVFGVLVVCRAPDSPAPTVGAG